MNQRPDPSTFASLLVLAAIGALLTGCASAPASLDTRLDRLLPADILLVGEQHDAAAHQDVERAVVENLAARKQLAALAIEMAEAGTDTGKLSSAATEAQVRTALRWNDDAWPWKNYAPVVMAAVKAGVPVIGANLPKARMKDAMADVSLDAQLSASAMQAQRDAIRDGHCGLLPAPQIEPMTRIQIARDREMAHTLAEARVAGRTVLLVSGTGHTSPALGVPQHLPTDARVRTLGLDAGSNADSAGFDAVWATPPAPPVDHCADLRRTLRKPGQGRAGPDPIEVLRLRA
ncbi:MAG: ChaN family lipoprotein [Janthinobacterium lividum]